MSSHPIPTRFILPSFAISCAHASESTSSTPPEENSLSRNEPELGDSDGGSSRIEIVRGIREVANVKIWGSGFRVPEGMERVSVGDSVVGGSYLN